MTADRAEDDGTVERLAYGDFPVRVLVGPDDIEIVAADLAKATGLNNTHLAISKVATTNRRIAKIRTLSTSPKGVAVLNGDGVVEMLSSKATTRAAKLLDWCRVQIFGRFGDHEPEQVRHAKTHLERQTAPWAGIAVRYHGEVLYVDPRTGRFWATQKQIAGIFGTTVRNVGKHLTAQIAEGFLDPIQCVAVQFLVHTEGDRIVTREVTLYNFRAICGVGDRVSTAKGQAFREWRADYVEEHLSRQMDENLDLKAEILELKRRNVHIEAIYKNPDAIEETAKLLTRYETLNASYDRMLEERLMENSDPFTGAPLHSIEQFDAARRRIDDYYRRCALIRAGKADELPPLPSRLGMTGTAVGLLRRLEPAALEGPAADPEAEELERAAKAERKLQAEMQSMDLKAEARVVRHMHLEKTSPSAFKTIHIGRHAVGLVAFDADRAADVSRNDDIAAREARILIDAAIERGERFLVTTDVEEVAADWRPWIAESKRRGEFVDLFLDPGGKSREVRIADLARVFADDGETRH